MDIFTEIGSSKTNTKSDNIKDGKGRLVVAEHIFDSMNEGATFVTRFVVLNAEAKGDPELLPFEPGKPHSQVTPVRIAQSNITGQNIGWVQKLDKFKSAKGNIKTYILALLGHSEENVSPDQFAVAMRDLVGKEQPGRGMVVDFSTYRQKTKSGANTGQINTYCGFTHVPVAAGNSKAEIAKRRAELDRTCPLSR